MNFLVGFNQVSLVPLPKTPIRLGKEIVCEIGVRLWSIYNRDRDDYGWREKLLKLSFRKINLPTAPLCRENWEVQKLEGKTVTELVGIKALRWCVVEGMEDGYIR